jgi:hypothetical protein
MEFAFMIQNIFFLWLTLLSQASPVDKQPLEKSARFAFADREYIFTIEIVKPGVPLLNFVSMADQDIKLLAKNIRLALENRKAVVKMLAVEGGDFQQPMKVISMTIHPRSSFGVRLDSDLGDTNELLGATIRLGNEDFKLAPMTSFDFENFALKVNRINLGSPDFKEDWRVLRLELLGSRSPVSRR